MYDNFIISREYNTNETLVCKLWIRYVNKVTLMSSSSHLLDSLTKQDIFTVCTLSSLDNQSQKDVPPISQMRCGGFYHEINYPKISHVFLRL